MAEIHYRYLGEGYLSKLGKDFLRSFYKVLLAEQKAFAFDNDFLAKAIASGAIVRFCRLKMFYHYLHDHSAVIGRPVQTAREFERIKKEHGVRDASLIMNLRIKLSQIIFPLFPKAIQDFYLRSSHYFKKQGKYNKIKPVWDGGFS